MWRVEVSCEGDWEERGPQTLLSISSIKLFGQEYPIRHQLPHGWLLSKSGRFFPESKGGNKLMGAQYSLCRQHGFSVLKS